MVTRTCLSVALYVHKLSCLLFVTEGPYGLGQKSSPIPKTVVGKYEFWAANVTNEKNFDTQGSVCVCGGGTYFMNLTLLTPTIRKQRTTCISLTDSAEHGVLAEKFPFATFFNKLPVFYWTCRFANPSQKPATGTFREPGDFNVRCYILFLKKYILMLWGLRLRGRSVWRLLCSGMWNHVN
jgi:hypothetical protein